jgi:hypothetical protein
MTSYHPNHQRRRLARELPATLRDPLVIPGRSSHIDYHALTSSATTTRGTQGRHRAAILN